MDSKYSLKVININKDPFIGSVISYKLPYVKEHHLILVPKMLQPVTLVIINKFNNGNLNIAEFLTPITTNSEYSLSKTEDVYDTNKYVQVRIFCKQKIPIRVKTKVHRILRPFNLFNTIIIHIHGGGFIASSSGTHQHYLRKWAIMLGFPLFSIDYRLAPMWQYPAPLDDALQAYYWIINYCFKYFGIFHY